MRSAYVLLYHFARTMLCVAIPFTKPLWTQCCLGGTFQHVLVLEIYFWFPLIKQRNVIYFPPMDTTGSTWSSYATSPSTCLCNAMQCNASVNKVPRGLPLSPIARYLLLPSVGSTFSTRNTLCVIVRIYTRCCIDLHIDRLVLFLAS